MKYSMLLYPHANARYRMEMQKLASAELSVMLSKLCPEASFEEESTPIGATIAIHCENALTPAQLDALSEHSLLYALFECAQDGLLRPLIGRKKPLFGDDLTGILKYKGKTNELFTQLLINAALYSGDFFRETDIELLDPMCGRGTTLFDGMNRGWNCTGSDIDKVDLKEAEQFFSRYLQYHKKKHKLTRTSLTVKGRKPAACAGFLLPGESEQQLRFIQADARDIRSALGKQRFHLIVTDLPYGVQHAANGGTPEALLKNALPGWRELLRVGGTVAVSFNAQTLKRETVERCFSEAGFTPVVFSEGVDFSHWVEQAVTRDLVVAKR